MFKNLLFPDRIAPKLVVTHNPNVIINKSDSGLEQRIVRGLGRVELSLSLSLIEEREIRDITALWLNVEGNSYSFRVRNHADWFCGYKQDRGMMDGLIEDDPHEIGVGNGANATFPLYREWKFGGFTAKKRVTKPRNSIQYPVTAFVDGTEVPISAVNYETGFITLASAPGNGDIVSWRGIFDTCVRFDGDLVLDLDRMNFGRTQNIKLIEVLGE